MITCGLLRKIKNKIEIKKKLGHFKVWEDQVESG